MTDATIAAEISEDPKKRGSGWYVIRRVAPYLWPEGQGWVKWRVMIALLLLLIAKVVAVLVPQFYKYAVDSLSGNGVPDLVLGAVGLTVAYGMARLMSVVFENLRDAIFAKVAQRALRRLALETFTHIHQLSLRYHITRRTGGLSRIIERGVKGVEFLLRFMLFSIGPLILEFLLIAALLYFQLDARFLLVIVVTVFAYTWFTFKVTEWRVKLRRIMNEEDTEANQKAIDSLLNFETVKYFGAEEREARRYDESMARFESASLKTSYSLAALNTGQSLIITSGLVIVMVLAALRVQEGTLTVGDFVMANAYMMQITMPLNFLGFVYREIRQSLVDMGEMFGLLEQPAEVTDRENAPDIKIEGGEVVLSDLRFGYEKDREILRGVSITIQSGQKVAIVGASGSGKSTIGRLLFRFYDVNSGTLKIDGQDVRDVTQKSLHHAIGVVPQDTVLFNDTIRYNIGYGREGASEAEIIEAAKSARIHDFISALPDGYDTAVGERGLKLSGGEKQRVGIARTLLKNPPILLLDEATSALDTETEQSIQDALERAGRGRTVITIAHRLSTISESDKIIVLEKGHVVEQGTHEALLAQDGRYAQLWALQLHEATTRG